eukprot:GHUV01029508.1.p1 GENE.GHUV01029508.1~~GHUV01029508.1.p1  ORF type:complete len:118 (-),score=20.30 GHUV01029508.1:150-503(-)
MSHYTLCNVLMLHLTGTPDYMSPQLLGAKACNQAALYDGTKADIWAAGVMLCVMLIGRFPFEGIEMSNATNLEEVSAHVSIPCDTMLELLHADPTAICVQFPSPGHHPFLLWGGLGA